MKSRFLIACLAGIAGSGISDKARAEPSPDEHISSIEELLKSGWEVTGYASNADNRSTFILFKNRAEPYLVQCLTGYDVTRTPRIFQNCYKLR